MLAGLVFAVVGLLGLWLTVRLALAARDIRRTWAEHEALREGGVEVPGTVIEVAGGRGRGGVVQYLPTVRFTTLAGHDVTGPPLQPWPTRFAAGDPLAVCYDPGQPERFTPAQQRPGTRSSFALAMTLLIGVLTAGTLFFAFRLWAVDYGHGFDIPGVDVPGVVLPSNR